MPTYRLPKSWLLATALGCLPLLVNAEPDEHLSEITSWLNGSYHNRERVGSQEAAGLESDGRHRFVEVRARPVEMSDVEQFTVLVEYRDLGDTLYDSVTESVLFKTGDGTLHHLLRRPASPSDQR